MDKANRDLLRDSARFVGPLLCLVGILLFFSAMASFGRPDPFGSGPPPGFMTAVVGTMFLGAGAFITKWAWIGPVAGYVAEETAPAVAVATRAVMQEVRAGPGAAVHACKRCKTENAADARFCKGCGANVAKTCAACNGGNAPDARFCDDCGKPLP